MDTVDAIGREAAKNLPVYVRPRPRGLGTGGGGVGEDPGGRRLRRYHASEPRQGPQRPPRIV